MKKLIFILILMPVVLYCSSGTYSLINELGIGAASGAMGDAYTSIESPVSILWNPAMLSADKRISLSYMHDKIPYGANYDAFAGAVSFSLPFEKDKNNAIGGGAYILSEEGIPITEAGEDTIPGTDFTNIVYKGTASYIYSRYDLSMKRSIYDFSIGVRGSYLYSSLYNIKGKGFSWGFGMGYKKSIPNYLISGVGVGLSYSAEGLLFWNNEYTDTIDCIYGAGINVRLLKNITESMNDGILISFDMSQDNIKIFDPAYSFGIEWKVFSIVPVRFGYKNNSLTTGLGFCTKYIDIDYAFMTNPVIASSHRLSITVKL